MTIEQLEFTEEAGDIDAHDVCIFALSTCGFCKACLRFLREKSVKFRYVYYDLLDNEIKDEVRNELKEKYSQRIMFPFVIVDEGTDAMKVIVGFKEEELKSSLDL
jgi:glutaredoxin